MKITNGHTSAMVLCVCGQMFQASGSSKSVDLKQHAFAAKHRGCVRPTREGRKVFWLSFCDSQRPTGQQFLGACVIDVTAEEADACGLDILLRFPFAQPDAEWLAAAIKKAHALGCNPGGEVASIEIQPDHPNLSRYQLGVLMDRATVECLEPPEADDAVREDSR